MHYITSEFFSFIMYFLTHLIISLNSKPETIKGAVSDFIDSLKSLKNKKKKDSNFVFSAHNKTTWLRLCYIISKRITTIIIIIAGRKLRPRRVFSLIVDHSHDWGMYKVKEIFLAFPGVTRVVSPREILHVACLGARWSLQVSITGSEVLSFEEALCALNMKAKCSRFLTTLEGGSQGHKLKRHTFMC